LFNLKKVQDGLTQIFTDIHRVQIKIENVYEINAGWEAHIIGFRLIEGDNFTDLVARIYNGTNASQVAIYEFNVMHNLEKTGYPVAEVYICNPENEPLGTPFIIMEKIPGNSLMDQFIVDPMNQAESLKLFSKLYVDLHKLAPRKIIPVKRKYKTTKGRLNHLFHSYEKNIRLENFPELTPILLWVQKESKIIENVPLCLLHRDFHPGNILFRTNGSPAVIDWTSADIGDFREDLAWTKMLASTFYSESLGDLFLKGYNSEYGKNINNIEYFEVLQILRRLTDFSFSISKGGRIVGMRDDVSKIMLNQKKHYQNVLSRLEKLTNLQVPGIYKIVSS